MKSKIIYSINIEILNYKTFIHNIFIQSPV